MAISAVSCFRLDESRRTMEIFWRLVQTQAILVLKPMSERDGSDIQQLWNWFWNSRSTQNRLKIQQESRPLSDSLFSDIDSKNLFGVVSGNREPEKVLIQQTEGIQRGDVKFFGFLAIVFIYLLFFYDKKHFWFIQYGRNYIRNFANRIHTAIEGRYDPNAKYEL